MKNIKDIKKIKMIATDLDNTLLRTNKTISDYTAGIFNKCRQNGIKVVFATARPKRTVLHLLDIIPADAVILHNGAVIYDGGERIFYCGISPDTTKNILHAISHDFPAATLSAEIDDVLYANFEVSILWNNTEAIFIDFSDSEKIIADLPDIPAEKIIAGMESVEISSDNEIRCFNKYLSDDLYIEMTSTDHKVIMIMNREAVKSNAVRRLADCYGYDMRETVSFGDDYNDVEMLKQCGIGVAVSNAIDEAKSAADYICESNDNDGVAKWIEANLM
jgi:Cof subfamily protein (haloacid dehalogenase superfamily)